MKAVKILRQAIAKGSNVVVVVYNHIQITFIGVCLFDLDANNYDKIKKESVEKGHIHFGLDRVRISAILHSLMQQHKFVLHDKCRYIFIVY